LAGTAHKQSGYPTQKGVYWRTEFTITTDEKKDTPAAREKHFSIHQPLELLMLTTYKAVSCHTIPSRTLPQDTGERFFFLSI
jgi:hypothetical protein